MRLAADWKELSDRFGGNGVVAYYKGEEVLLDPQNPPVTPVASCTKSLLAVAAFKFQEMGLLKLNDKVSDIMSDWTHWREGERNPKRDITLRHLATHTAGLPGNKFFRPQDKVNGVRGDEQFNNHMKGSLNYRASCHDLKYEVGSFFDYSNPGTQLLSAPLTERLPRSCASLSDFIGREILDPLGMSQSFLLSHDGDVYFYGGLQTTVLELARLGLMVVNQGTLDGKRILTPESVREMLSTPADIPGALKHYGHLWQKPPGLRCFLAAGDGNNMVAILPDFNVVLARTQGLSANKAECDAQLNDEGRFTEEFGELLGRFFARPDLPARENNPLAKLLF